MTLSQRRTACTHRPVVNTIIDILDNSAQVIYKQTIVVYRVVKVCGGKSDASDEEEEGGTR